VDEDDDDVTKANATCDPMVQCMTSQSRLWRHFDCVTVVLAIGPPWQRGRLLDRYDLVKHNKENELVRDQSNPSLVVKVARDNFYSYRQILVAS